MMTDARHKIASLATSVHPMSGLAQGWYFARVDFRTRLWLGCDGLGKDARARRPRRGDRDDSCGDASRRRDPHVLEEDTVGLALGLVLLNEKLEVSRVERMQTLQTVFTRYPTIQVFGRRVIDEIDLDKNQDPLFEYETRRNAMRKRPLEVAWVTLAKGIERFELQHDWIVINARHITRNRKSKYDHNDLIALALTITGDYKTRK
jgi:hypothetical protein